jgi:molybdenum cofactor cytidylyltransferase
MKKIYAVVLAAGMSSRLNSNKLLLRIDGKRTILRAVEPFVTEGITRILVVTGSGGDAVKAALEEDLRGYTELIGFVHNGNYAQGMSSSFKAVLPYLGESEGVFFHLGDKPFLERTVVERMLGLYGQGPEKIIVPEFKGERGHPVLFDVRSYEEEIRRLEGDKGLREVIEKHSGNVLSIEGNEGCVIDIDCEDDIVLLEKRGYGIEKG